MSQEKTTITIDIMYYHPQDENGNVDESKKVYDFEGMADEFEDRLSELDESVVVMCSVSTEDADVDDTPQITGIPNGDTMSDTDDNDWSNFNSPPKF